MIVMILSVSVRSYFFLVIFKHKYMNADYIIADYQCSNKLRFKDVNIPTIYYITTFLLLFYDLFNTRSLEHFFIFHFYFH